MTDPKPPRIALHALVEQYLSIALVEPDEPPKTQRAQRENRMLIIGFNRAQETLRTLLAAHGDNPKVRALAEVRHESQSRPIDVAGTKVWVAS